MLEKTLFNQILSRIKVGALTVKYWDGSQQTFGTGKPYFTMTFHSPSALKAMFKNMTLGFGESYMNGFIDIDGPLDHVARLVTENSEAFKKLALTKLSAKLQRNTRTKQAGQIQHHYDLGNDFYKLWLDESLTYSCAYFKKSTDTLEQAQKQKVDHILRKLQLSKGQTLLDIGSGWGTLLITAAKKYGVTGLGVTLSKEQLAGSIAKAKAQGVDHLVRFELINYQDLPKRKLAYDRVVSVGMYEHVGEGNSAEYHTAVQQLLAPEGIAVLHTITKQVYKRQDPWIDKYIFPGHYLPDISEVAADLAKFGFQLLDYENLRIHYAMTLDEWWRRFELHKDEVIAKYGQPFYRMWRLYLAASSSGFRYGDLSLSQYVYTRPGNNSLPLTRDHLYKGK